MGCSIRYPRVLRLMKVSLSNFKSTQHISKLIVRLLACSISLTSFEETMKGDVPRRIGRTKGGLNSKLHAVCDGHGRPIILLLSEGQMSDYMPMPSLLQNGYWPIVVTMQTGSAKP